MEYLDPGSRWKIFDADALVSARAEGEVLIIDARDSGAYEGGHILEAIHCTPESFSLNPALVYDWFHEGVTNIVVYCSHDRCDAAAALLRLLEQDPELAPKIALLSGGWQRAKDCPSISISRDGSW
jgi:rhodanese-related sulfurtransferase